MAGLPKKYAKMGFSKGWKAYRASKGMKKKAGSTVAARKRRKTSARRVVRRAASGARRSYRRAKSYVSRKPLLSRGLRIVVDGAILTSGIFVANGLINYVPYVKDMSAGTKALTQGAAGGLVIMFSKSKNAKLIGSGMVAASIINGAKQIPFFQGLAGTSSRMQLTPQELRALTMGVPERVLSNRSMGIPEKVMSGSWQNAYSATSW